MTYEKKFETVLTALAEIIEKRDFDIMMKDYEIKSLKEKLEAAEKALCEKEVTA